MARSVDFQSGADSVRSPQFKSVQQQHGVNFRAMSVLDTPAVIPNQNGIGAQDLQRKIMGVRDSGSGRSQSTSDSQIWLTNPDTAHRKDQSNG